MFTREAAIELRERILERLRTDEALGFEDCGHAELLLNANALLMEASDLLKQFEVEQLEEWIREKEANANKHRQLDPWQPAKDCWNAEYGAYKQVLAKIAELKEE